MGVISEWVTLDEMKNDQTLRGMAFTRDDEDMQMILTAAMEWVQDHRPDLTYLGAHTVPEYVRLGTIRLAARWFIRRVSPNGIVQMGEMGATVVASPVDPDVYTQLGIMGGFS